MDEHLKLRAQCLSGSSTPSPHQGASEGGALRTEQEWSEHGGFLSHWQIKRYQCRQPGQAKRWNAFQNLLISLYFPWL